ncbi:hypothetical protein ACHAQA_009701 [Verticillium albo-atrum]
MPFEPRCQPSPLLMSPGRLQKIDQLRERNIGSYIPLPQLVAVGDQSSGKSALLESATGIPFPRSQDLCTRYATQITHRREAHQRIDITISPNNVDVATQEILTLAEEADSAGDRTLGILTKVDLLKEHSAKSAMTNLVEGHRKPLKLGYHVVANRGGDDNSDEDDALATLRERETMFLEYPWHNLPEDRVGIHALRGSLEDLLGEITDQREQQQYLVSMASNFRVLVRAALDADYSAHSAFDRNQLRLITAVINTTEQFNIKFDACARTYLFEPEVTAAVPVEVATPLSGIFPLENARIKETLRPKARKEHPGRAFDNLIINLSDIADAVTNKSNAAHANETIHDILEAYYKVAYKRQPLRLFSEQWVLDLKTEKLRTLAGESHLARESRERLKKEIQDVEVAMQILL